jgi:hypothetical protein
MHNIDPSCRDCPSDRLVWSGISEEISDVVAASITGGATAGVIANAYATGDYSLAWTNTNTNVRQFASGGSIATGWGSALASGNNPSTNVSFFGSGDSVLAYTTTTNYSNSSNKNLSTSSGFFLATDY